MDKVDNYMMIINIIIVKIMVDFKQLISMFIIMKIIK